MYYNSGEIIFLKRHYQIYFPKMWCCSTSAIRYENSRSNPNKQR